MVTLHEHGSDLTLIEDVATLAHTLHIHLLIVENVDYVQNVLNRCWICVEFLWIICRIYVDYMSNKCWIDVEYIQSRLEANQWKTRLCWSYMVKPVGARLRDDRPLLVRRKFWFTAPCHVTTWSKALNCLSLPWSRLESGVSIVGISLIFL